MSFLNELHKDMKLRSDERSEVTLSYNDSIVIVKLFKEGTAWSFTHDNFKKLLTFLNESAIMMGREKALDEYKNGE